ncbi:hypothetical protein BV898_01185 [Hypsibius exemplaris]|uniref:Uncharacterized protein n=1 Tax=Hypsibius exemplaris TaxID=2072580 RepID=A0A1W0XBU8_HYPEX|nr:hypothetical protein BV898_01185 [Hypsibius exemplaris]
MSVTVSHETFLDEDVITVAASSTNPTTPVKTLDDNASDEASIQGEQIRRNSLYGLFRPLLILMRLGGMFYIQPKALHLQLNRIKDLSITVRPPATAGHQLSSSRRCRRGTLWEWFERCSQLYCILVFIIILTYGGKFLYNFQFGVGRLPFSVCNLGVIVGHSAYAIWIVEVMLTQAIMLHACWNKAQMYQLFTGWDHLYFPCPLASGTCPSFAELFRGRRNLLVGLAATNSLTTAIFMTVPLIFRTSAFAELRNVLYQGRRIVKDP